MAAYQSIEIKLHSNVFNVKPVKKKNSICVLTIDPYAPCLRLGSLVINVTENKTEKNKRVCTSSDIMTSSLDKD